MCVCVKERERETECVCWGSVCQCTVSLSRALTLAAPTPDPGAATQSPCLPQPSPAETGYMGGGMGTPRHQPPHTLHSRQEAPGPKQLGQGWLQDGGEGRARAADGSRAEQRGGGGAPLSMAPWAVTQPANP